MHIICFHHRDSDDIMLCDCKEYSCNKKDLKLNNGNYCKLSNLSLTLYLISNLFIPC